VAATRRGFVLLGMGFAGWTLSYILRMMIPPLLLLIVEELRLSGFEAGVLMSAFFATYALMQVPAGLLTDKVSRKSMISICIAFSSLATLLSALVLNYNQLVLARALFGLAAGAYYSPMISMLSDAFEPKFRGRAVGFFMSGSRLGSAVAPLIGVQIAIAYGWRAAFIVCAIPGFILALAFHLFVSEPFRGSASSYSFKLIRDNFGALLFAYLIPAILMMGSMGLATFLPSYFMSSKGLSIDDAALMVSISSLAGFAGQIFGGFLTDRIGCKKAMVLITSLTLASIFMLHVSPPAHVVLPAIFFGFISAGGAAPIITYTVESSPESIKGLSLGIGNTTGFLGASIGSAIGGVVVDLFGYDQLMTFIFGAYSLTCLLAIFMPVKRVDKLN